MRMSGRLIFFLAHAPPGAVYPRAVAATHLSAF